MIEVKQLNPSTTASSPARASLEAGRSLLLMVGFAVLTALAAQVRIPLPFTPVPITMQTLVVLLAGAALGPWRGGISQALYLAWGASGLPMFAGMATGFAILAGPTGGYIVGFIAAALLVGVLLRRAHTTVTIASVFTLGTVTILLAGWAHLALFYTGGHPMTALQLGVLPFLPGAAFKIAAATGIWTAVRALRRS